MTESASVAPVPTTLAQLAELVAGRLEGDPGHTVHGVGAVDEAGSDQIAFLSSKRWTKHLPGSAGAFLVTEELEEHVADRARIVVDRPHIALLATLRHFHPDPPVEPGIHPTAVLGEGVRLGEAVHLGPYVVVDDGASIGDGTRLGAHCVIGRGARVGARCTLHPHVVVYPGASLGDRVIAHSGARVGADGFGYVFQDGAHQKIPHVGRCIVEDDVEIGANTTLDRGSIGNTVVGRGTKLDNLVMIAHNVHLGEHSMLAAMVGVAGSTRVGKGVWMGGQAGVGNHLEVGDGARLAIAAKVWGDVPAGETFSGHPARPHKETLQKQANLSRLPRLTARVKTLEAELAKLRERAD